MNIRKPEEIHHWWLPPALHATLYSNHVDLGGERTKNSASGRDQTRLNLRSNVTWGVKFKRNANAKNWSVAIQYFCGVILQFFLFFPQLKNICAAGFSAIHMWYLHAICLNTFAIEYKAGLCQNPQIINHDCKCGAISMMAKPWKIESFVATSPHRWPQSWQNISQIGSFPHHTGCKWLVTFETT